jgi:hypothetical protein
MLHPGAEVKGTGQFLFVIDLLIGLNKIKQMDFIIKRYVRVVRGKKSSFFTCRDIFPNF